MHAADLVMAGHSWTVLQQHCSDCIFLRVFDCDLFKILASLRHLLHLRRVTSRLTFGSMALVPRAAVALMSMLLVKSVISEVDKRRRKPKKGKQQQATAPHDDTAAVCLTPEGQVEHKANVNSTPAVVFVDADFEDDITADSAGSTAALAEVPQKAELGMTLLLLRTVSVLLCCVISFVEFMYIVGITWTTLGSASLVLVALAAPMAASQVRSISSRWHKALDDAMGGSVSETSGQAWDNSFI